MILAGEIGGIRTRMGLFDDSLRPLKHNAFLNKGRFENVTRDMPVYVVLDKDTGLKGAVRRASLSG